MHHFDISRNFIKDEGACWILSSTAHVREVFMSQNQITSKSALTISEILKQSICEGRKIVDLTNNDLEGGANMLINLIDQSLSILLN